MLIHLELAVQPHVKKYLIYHLSANYKMSQNDLQGMYLRSLLRSPFTDRKYDPLVASFSEVFKFAIVPTDLWHKQCKNLTSSTVFKFNKFNANLIKAELHAFVDERIEGGFGQNQAIHIFRAKYGFEEEDISFETLKKSFQRYKAAKSLGLLANKAPFPSLQNLAS